MKETYTPNQIRSATVVGKGSTTTILTTTLPVISKELLGGNASSYTKKAQDADMEHCAIAENACIDTLM